MFICARSFLFAKLHSLRSIAVHFPYFSEPEYGAYNSPTLGTRHQATIAVSDAEANGESGFNNTADIVVEEPESGTLEVGSVMTDHRLIHNSLALC